MKLAGIFYNELVKFLIPFISAQIVRAIAFRNGLDRDRNGRVRIAHFGTLGEAHLCGGKG
jgi:hypothetical protein